MRTVTIDVRTDTSTTINIGRQCENEVTQIVFDFSVFVEEFGTGRIALTVQRNKYDTPYPVVLDVDGNEAIWAVSNVDTQYKGTGRIQLSYVVDEQVKKSVIYRIKIDPSITQSSDTPPEPYESYLEQIEAIGADITEKYAGISETAEHIDQVDSDFREYSARVITDITDLKTGALSDIGNAHTTALGEISTAKSGALTDIEDLKDTSLDAIDDAKESAVARIDSLVMMVTDTNRDGNIAIVSGNLNYSDIDHGNIVIAIGG